MGKIIDRLYQVLPEKTFRNLSKQYYHVLKKLYRPFSEDDFKNILMNSLDVKHGSVVFIHSSFDKMNLSFSPYRALQILMETVGSEGTVLFPAWHYIGRAEDYLKSGKVFDVKRSPSVLGLLPELARRHNYAHRSLHPTASIVAIGKHAEELTSQHHIDIYPCGENSPMYLMMKYNARIIGLGEKVVSLSFVHCVEDIMKNDFPVETLKDHTLSGQVKDYNRRIQTVNTLVPHLRIQNRDMPGFFDQHIPSNICSRYRKRGVNFFNCDAKSLFDRMKVLASTGITIYNNTGG